MTKKVPPSPTLARIPLEWIRPSPQRHYYGTQRLESLSDRMRVHGLVTPIIVRRATEGYEIVDGMRRWWAARFLGWRSIDAKILPS
jgi:ParB family chromosome partitioning protein